MGILDLHAHGDRPLVALPSPGLQKRVLFSAPNEGLTLSLWSCPPRIETHGPSTADEFFLLLEGSVTIRQPDGRAETLRAGDAFFIPRGLEYRWDQSGPALMILMRFADGTAIPGAGLPLRVDPHARLAASEGPSPAVLIGPEPQQQTRDFHADASGRFSVGVWATTPYVRRPIPYSRHELMHLVEGAVTLTADGEAPRTYRAGDSLFVPRGCVIDWVSTVPVRKIFCSVLPPP